MQTMRMQGYQKNGGESVNSTPPRHSNQLPRVIANGGFTDQVQVTFRIGMGDPSH